MRGVGPLRQTNLAAAAGAALPQINFQPGIIPVDFLITHAMQIAGGDQIVVAAVPNLAYLPVFWWMQKDIQVAAYAPTNTTFNLRWQGLATNAAAGITPVVTGLGVRIDDGIGVSLGNIGAGVLSAVYGRALCINCGAANGGGSASNKGLAVRIWYAPIPQRFL